MIVTNPGREGWRTLLALTRNSTAAASRGEEDLMNKPNRNLLIALAVTAVGMLLLPAFSQPALAGGAPADGAALYKTKCAPCHSPDGSGTSPMGKKMGVLDLGSPDVQKQSDAELAKITTDGKNKMPAFKGKLTDEEVAALVKHIRTFKK